MGIRGLFEGWHLIILLLVIVVLFGAKRLPDASRAIGKSMRIFKSEVKELTGNEDDDDHPTATAQRSEAPRDAGNPDKPSTVAPAGPVQTSSGTEVPATADREPAGQQRV